MAAIMAERDMLKTRLKEQEDAVKHADAVVADAAAVEARHAREIEGREESLRQLAADADGAAEEAARATAALADAREPLERVTAERDAAAVDDVRTVYADFQELQAQAQAMYGELEAARAQLAASASAPATPGPFGGAAPAPGPSTRRPPLVAAAEEAETDRKYRKRDSLRAFENAVKKLEAAEASAASSGPSTRSRPEPAAASRIAELEAAQRPVFDAAAALPGFPRRRPPGPLRRRRRRRGARPLRRAGRRARAGPQGGAVHRRERAGGRDGGEAGARGLAAVGLGRRAEIAARDEALEEKAAAKRDLEAALRGDLDAAHAALVSRDEALEEMRKDKHYRKQDSLRAYNNAIKKLEATEAERDAGLEAVAALEARLAQAAADLQAAQLPAPAHQRSLSTVEGAYAGGAFDAPAPGAFDAPAPVDASGAFDAPAPGAFDAPAPGAFARRRIRRADGLRRAGPLRRAGARRRGGPSTRPATPRCGPSSPRPVPRARSTTSSSRPRATSPRASRRRRRRCARPPPPPRRARRTRRPRATRSRPSSTRRADLRGGDADADAPALLSTAEGAYAGAPAGAFGVVDAPDLRVRVAELEAELATAKAAFPADADVQSIRAQLALRQTEVAEAHAKAATLETELAAARQAIDASAHRRTSEDERLFSKTEVEIKTAELARVTALYEQAAEASKQLADEFESRSLACRCAEETRDAAIADVKRWAEIKSSTRLQYARMRQRATGDALDDERALRGGEESLRDELRALERRLADVDLSAVAAEEKLCDARIALTPQQEVLKLTQDLADARAAAQRRTASESSQFAADLAEAKEALKAAPRGEHDATVGAFQETLEETEAQRKTWEDRAKKTKARLKALEADGDDARALDAEALEALRLSSVEDAERVEALERSNDKLARELAQVKADNEATARDELRFQEHREAAATSARSAATLEARCAELELDAARRAKAALEEAAAKAAALEEQLEVARARGDEIEQSLEDAETARDAEAEHRESTEAMWEEHMTAAAGYQERLDAAEKRVRELEQAKAAPACDEGERLATLEAELSETRRSLELSRAEPDDLRAKLEEAEAAADEAEMLWEERGADLEALEQERDALLEARGDPARRV
ncbi:hypothetical protein JL720_9135 [Aureococcus anophagefferens]|nr:hypothetical protein JL720_9135 [Aureococcus anophagefferens]